MRGRACHYVTKCIDWFQKHQIEIEKERKRMKEREKERAGGKEHSKRPKNSDKDKNQKFVISQENINS